MISKREEKRQAKDKARPDYHKPSGPLFDALVKWIGEAPVSIRYVDRKGPVGPAHIEAEAGVLVFSSSFEGECGATFLSHDIAHVLAAYDVDLFKPNLGLGKSGPMGAPGSRERESERCNEERTIAYQMALLRHLTGTTHEYYFKGLFKTLGRVVVVREESVAMHFASLTPEKVRAEWDRKMALVSSMTREPVAI